LGCSRRLCVVQEVKAIIGMKYEACTQPSAHTAWDSRMLPPLVSPGQTDRFIAVLRCSSAMNTVLNEYKVE